MIKNKFLVISKNISLISDLKALESPQMQVVKAVMGEDFTITLVIRAVNEICIATNTTMHLDVMTMIATSIIEDFWDWHIDEILKVLADGIKKKYGEISFGGLSYPTIMGWFEKKNLERSEMFENRHMDKKALGTIGESSRTSQPEPLDGIIRGLGAIRSGLIDAGHKPSADENYFSNEKNLKYIPKEVNTNE